MCVYHCTQLSYTTQHRTVLIIFPLILMAQMMSRGKLARGDRPPTKLSPQLGVSTWTVVSVAVVHLSVRAAAVSAIVRRRRRITATCSDACSSATRKSARSPLRPRAPLAVHYNNIQQHNHWHIQHFVGGDKFN